MPTARARDPLSVGPASLPAAAGTEARPTGTEARPTGAEARPTSTAARSTDTSECRHLPYLSGSAVVTSSLSTLKSLSAETAKRSDIV